MKVPFLVIGFVGIFASSIAAAQAFPTDISPAKEGEKCVNGEVKDPTARSVELFVNGSATPAGRTTTIDSATGKFQICLSDTTKFFLQNQTLVLKPDHGAPSAPIVVDPPKGLPADVAPVHAGDNLLTIIVHVEGVTSAELTVNGKKATDAIFKADEKSKDKFTLTLNTTKLLVNQIVVVTPNKGGPSDPVVVAAGEAPEVAALKEGDKTVTGVAPEGADHVLVTVKDHNGAFIEEKSVEPDKTTRNFTAGLSRALTEDSTVEVTGVKSSTVAGVTSSTKGKPTTVTVETAEYNWGRVRAYFSVGASASKDDSNFQKVRPYLSLNLDKNWLNSVHCYEDTDAKSNATAEEIAAENKSYRDYKKKHEDGAWRCDKKPFNARSWYVLLNTYFEARLETANALAVSDVNTANLKTADKVGHFEFGVYLPINSVRSSWKYDGKRYALFLAPIFKGGVDTIPSVTPSTSPSTSTTGTTTTGTTTTTTGTTTTTTTTTSGTTTTTTTSPTAAAPTPATNNKFFDGGIRLGHYRAYGNSHSVAPELISWVDFTWGRWDRLLAPQGSSTTGAKPGTMHFEITGRLKIPYSPFTIGLTSNSGPSGVGEFSLFVGMRFDLTKVLSKLAPEIK